MLHSRRGDRGSIFLITVILITLLMGFSVALLRGAATSKQGNLKGQQYDRALDVAEAGVDYTINQMNFWRSGTISTVSLTFGSNAATVTVSPAFAGTVGTYTLKSTGSAGGTTHTITVVVNAVYNGVWQYGLFSNQTLDLSSNELSDSWRSSAPPVGSPVYDRSGSPTVYDNQATNHYGSHTYALANGSDGSNNNVVFANSNNYVFGNAVPGPGDSVTLDGAYVSGSTAPASSAFPFPAITVPTVAGTPPGLSVASHASATIAAGTYHYHAITTYSNSTLTIRGPATIVVDSLTMDSNTNFTLDTSGGPITFYGTGLFVMASNSSTLGPSSGVPSDLQVYLTGDNYTGYSNTSRYPEGNPVMPIGFSSNNAMVGAIYAPNAVVNLPSNYGLYGSCVAQELGPASNFTVHYDQNLASVGGAPVYKMTVWYENPSDQ